MSRHENASPRQECFERSWADSNVFERQSLWDEGHKGAMGNRRDRRKHRVRSPRVKLSFHGRRNVTRHVGAIAISVESDHPSRECRGQLSSPLTAAEDRARTYPGRCSSAAPTSRAGCRGGNVMRSGQIFLRIREPIGARATVPKPPAFARNASAGKREGCPPKGTVAKAD